MLLVLLASSLLILYFVHQNKVTNKNLEEKIEEQTDYPTSDIKARAFNLKEGIDLSENSYQNLKRNTWK